MHVPAVHFLRSTCNVELINKGISGADARFTGKPYDEDLQAFVFPFRNYNPVAARWMSVDPSGYPDGINAHFYAGCPTIGLDPLGLAWGTWDFIKHFYLGGGVGVSLDYMGLTAAISNSDGGISAYIDLSIKTADDANNKAPDTGGFYSHKSGGYSFKDVAFCIGGATVKGTFQGTLTKTKEYEDGTAEYSYSGTAYMVFSDIFTDPASILEYLYGTSNPANAPDWFKNLTDLGGTAFNIMGNWEKTISGTFEK